MSCADLICDIKLSYVSIILRMAVPNVNTEGHATICPGVWTLQRDDDNDDDDVIMNTRM